jgi:hypothetical protein
MVAKFSWRWEVGIELRVSEDRLEGGDSKVGRVGEYVSWVW